MQTNFKDLSTYAKNIKFAALKYTEMGKIISNKILGLFFRMRLSSDLEPYIFQLVQTAKDLAQKLTINNIIAALIDYNK